eukprot:606540-Pyramimonas_sp.AAC.1
MPVIVAFGRPIVEQVRELHLAVAPVQGRDRFNAPIRNMVAMKRLAANSGGEPFRTLTLFMFV